MCVVLIMCSLTTGANGQVAVIDLHGQHVAEALKLLRRELTRLRSSAAVQNRQPAKSGNRRVQILVGTNHHSKVRHILTIPYRGPDAGIRSAYPGIGG